MPNPSLLAPPDFQTLLRPCVNELHSNNVYAQWQVVVYAELSMFFFSFSVIHLKCLIAIHSQISA